MRMDAYEVSLKRKFVLEKLGELGITHSPTGSSIHDLGYEELKRVLAVENCRSIDVHSSSEAWF